jgi:hypothetical protein
MQDHRIRESNPASRIVTDKLFKESCYLFFLSFFSFFFLLGCVVKRYVHIKYSATYFGTGHYISGIISLLSVGTLLSVSHILSTHPYRINPVWVQVCVKCGNFGYFHGDVAAPV